MVLPMAIQDDVANVQLRRFKRVKRPAISNDYVVHLQGYDFDVNMSFDLITFQEVNSCPKYWSWTHVMHDEISSMYYNGVLELLELPNECKPIGFKTKRNAKAQVEWCKAKLMAKGLNYKEGIDYKEIYSPVSNKDLF